MAHSMQYSAPFAAQCVHHGSYIVENSPALALHTSSNEGSLTFRLHFVCAILKFENLIQSRIKQSNSINSFEGELPDCLPSFNFSNTQLWTQ